MSLVLAVDVGTTCMKCAIVEDGMHSRAVAEMPYPMNIRGGEQRDIDTGHWWSAFEFCCSSLREFTGDVQAISFSVSTPGAVLLDPDGEALSPAVLFLDGRSKSEAQQIRDLIGEDELLEVTSNLPVSGGCTASTLLWWKNHQPELFKQAFMFGHTNTLFCKRLTGNWGMDPSTASLTALYNTTTNDGKWNESIAERLGIPIEKLPPIINSWVPVGELLPEWSVKLGLPKSIPVLMGGNDAMCAALSGGVTHEGAILDICGTCEIICIGLGQSLPGRQYNIRCHVIPRLWSTLYVLNTGGKALEWFHQNFCRELSSDQFYLDYVPKTIAEYLDSAAAWELPEYEVFLAGDRYSTEPGYAALNKLTVETTREHMLISMIRANNQYLARHLLEMSGKVKLEPRIHLTGGGLSESLIRCKRRWMGEYDYVLRSNSSLLGAAQLAHYHLTGMATWLFEGEQS